MEKKSAILLGLAVSIVLVLTVGVAYGMMGQSQVAQGSSTHGSAGGNGYGGMMRGYGSGYGSGMMSQGMMGGYGTMMGGYGRMGPCSNYTTGHSIRPLNSTWNDNVVTIVNYGFYPSTLTVSRGTTVTWVNMDFVQHTVTSGSEQAPTGLFDSHELNHMQSFSYTFDTPGTYTYFCDIHPGMVGTVVVTS